MAKKKATVTKSAQLVMPKPKATAWNSNVFGTTAAAAKGATAKAHPAATPNAKAVQVRIPSSGDVVTIPVVDPPPDLSQIPGGVFPIRAQVVQLSQYRVNRGWPVEPPLYDSRTEVLVSCTGEYVANRPQPMSIQTGAAVRWIADDDFYDGLSWRPWKSDFGGAEMKTALDFAPTYVGSYEYNIGKEVFEQQAINFDADNNEHFWMDIPALPGLNGYTMIMALSLNSVFGNRPDINGDLADVEFSGVLAPGGPPGFGDYFTEALDGVSLHCRGNTLYLKSEQVAEQKALDVGSFMRTNVPFFLALTVGYPVTTLTLGAGPSNLISKSFLMGATQPEMSSKLVLGRSQGTIVNSADMALFDVNLYAERLTPAQIKTEISILSGCYGGADK